MPMPYELRSPEDIAMEYGGNKQKIGAAVQAGLLDPTAGVLAGMFIDRMRNAAVEEQVPATTVAQDTMSPRPAPAAVPAGLAAMQPQGVPAPGAGAVPAGPAMPTPMPQGMARGGETRKEEEYVAPEWFLQMGRWAEEGLPSKTLNFLTGSGWKSDKELKEGRKDFERWIEEKYRERGETYYRARGGLTSLDVPDTMYDYGMGGIVAFAEGDEVEERLRLLPVDNLADAYVFLQSRGAEIPEDMSEQAVINYANRIREQENMEVKESGVRVPAEPVPAITPSGAPFSAPRVDYGRAADPTRAEEIRDAAPDAGVSGTPEYTPSFEMQAPAQRALPGAPAMPINGGEYAPGFAPTGPIQRGLMPPKGPSGPMDSEPERAIPFLGQLMEAIVPTAQASEYRNGAAVVTPEAARAELANIAPDWYDASQRSDAQVVKDLADFKEGTYRTKMDTIVADEAYDVDEIEEAGVTALMSKDLNDARNWLKKNAPDWYDMSKRSDAQIIEDYQDFLRGSYRPKEEAKEIDEIEEAGLTALGSRTFPEVTRQRPMSDVDAETQRRLDALFKDPEYQNMLMPGLRGVKEQYDLADQLEAQGLNQRAAGVREEAASGLEQLKKLPVYQRLEMTDPQARVDQKLAQANKPGWFGGTVTNAFGTSGEDAARMAEEAAREQEQIDRARGVPFGSVQMDEIQRMFPTMKTSVAPSAAQDEADFLNKNYLGRKVEEYSLSPKMPTAPEMGFQAAEIPPEVAQTPDAGLGAITPPGQVSDPKLAGLFGDEKAKNMALLELGARLMAGTSPYALQNLGTAATGTLQSIREQQKTASDRLLKERMLQIEEAKALKEKDTDERNRLRILESGTPGERAALKELMAAEQAVAQARASTYGMAQTGKTYLDYKQDILATDVNLRLDLMSDDPKVRSNAESRLENKIKQEMARSGVRSAPAATGLEGMNLGSSDRYSGWGQLQ